MQLCSYSSSKSPPPTHLFMGCDLQWGACFGCSGNTNDWLRVRLAELGLERNNNRCCSVGEAPAAALGRVESVLRRDVRAVVGEGEVGDVLAAAAAGGRRRRRALGTVCKLNIATLFAVRLDRSTGRSVGEGGSRSLPGSASD